MANVLHTKFTCCCHQGHRVVENRERWNVGNVFAIKFVCTQPTVQNTVQRAFSKWLQTLVYIPGEASDSQLRRNAKIVAHVLSYKYEGADIEGLRSWKKKSSKLRSGIQNRLEDCIALGDVPAFLQWRLVVEDTDSSLFWMLLQPRRSDCTHVFCGNRRRHHFVGRQAAICRRLGFYRSGLLYGLPWDFVPRCVTCNC